MLVVPSGIEPLPTASEAIVLSIGPRDQRVRAEAGMRNGRCWTWQGEDFVFSNGHAVPRGPECGGLRGVGYDFQKQGFFTRCEPVKVVGGADAQVVHRPEGGETGEIDALRIGQPLDGARAHRLEAGETLENCAAAIVDDGQDAAVAIDLPKDERRGEIVERG